MTEIFRAAAVDTTTEHFIFEITGAPAKIEKFMP